MGVKFNLVYGRHDSCLANKVGEFVQHEIADPNRAHVSTCYKRFKSAIGRNVRPKSKGRG